MHREEAADAVPGAVAIIEPRIPKRATCEAIDVDAAGAGREPRRRDGDMALEHKRVVPPHLFGGRPDRDGSRHIRGAVAILAARVDQVQRSRLQRLVRLRCRPVVHDGAVRARAGNRVEAQIFEQARIPPEGFEAVRCGDLGEIAGWRIPRQARRRTGTTPPRRGLRVACALQLHRILAGLEQDAWIGGLDQSCAARFQRVGDMKRRLRRIDNDLRPFLDQVPEAHPRARRGHGCRPAAR